MTWNFADSFDLYAAPADAINGYWDSLAGTGSSFVAGRFSGSRALNVSNSYSLVKASNVNDAVHHFVCSFETTNFTGTALGLYFELLDGATAQCSVVFRNDGAILLTSGGPTGTVLATYTGAFSAASVWYAFEIEVVINNITGSFTVRKNGNTVADFTATGLDTQNSANAYANKLTLGSGASIAVHVVDDFFWRSDASSVAWMGDIRCYTRMPTSDASVTFSRSGTRTASVPGSGGNVTAANRAYYWPVIMPCDGTFAAATIHLAAAYTGNMKCAIFSDNAGAPGAVLATATNVLTNPPVGDPVFTFSPTAVTNGQKVWMSVCTDTALGSSLFLGSGATGTGFFGTTAFASFPVANPASLSANQLLASTILINPTNSGLVNEAQQDGAVTYVYDSNPGDADFYNLASIPSTPSSVIATVLRAYAMKSDAGSRTAAVQLKSGATTVASPTTALTTSGWQWLSRMDLTDPNTGAAWTPAAVNSAQIGPTVIA